MLAYSLIHCDNLVDFKFKGVWLKVFGEQISNVETGILNVKDAMITITGAKYIF